MTSFIYVVESDWNPLIGFLKIGYTANSPKRRFETIGKDNTFFSKPFKVKALFKVKGGRRIEEKIHFMLKLGIKDFDFLKQLNGGNTPPKEWRRTTVQEIAEIVENSQGFVYRFEIPEEGCHIEDLPPIYADAPSKLPKRPSTVQEINERFKPRKPRFRKDD